MSDGEVDVVWVRATMSFGDVERGDVFELTPDRVTALGHYVEPVDLDTFDVNQDMASATVPVELGEPAVSFEGADDGQGGHLPTED